MQQKNSLHTGEFQLGERANVFTRPAMNLYLDGFDQVGGAVGHLLGRLDKVPLGSWVGCLGGRQTAGVAQCRGVLSNNGGCRENLPHYKQRGRSATGLISNSGLKFSPQLLTSL